MDDIELDNLDNSPEELPEEQQEARKQTLIPSGDIKV